MSRRPVTRREDGSLPLAMLATIVVAGLITVVIARSIAGERAVRFDRNFGESLQVADVGVNRGLFALNEGREDMLPTPASPRSEVVDGISYEWWAEKTGAQREWRVTSEATANDVSRRVVANIEEVPLFFPGAFGDKLIALNGNSTKVDSYNSDPDCTELSRVCGWGSTNGVASQHEFGTGNGSIGTNEDFVFSGTTTIRPGGAFLYDWENNPGQNATTDDPFGDRCTGQNVCTTTFVETVPDKLDFSSSEQVAFITDKFEPSGGCHNNSNPRQKGPWQLGTRSSTNPPTLVSYATSKSQAPGINDPTDSAFTNYYCAHSLEFVGNLRLDPSVTVDNPVVIFVKDFMKVSNPNQNIACYGGANDLVQCSNRNLTPAAGRLQIYVGGLPHGGASSGDVSVKAGSTFAGVVYAPLSQCSGEGGAGVNIYGAIICGSMNNVGNWNFHYDDALGANGAGQFNVSFWQEVPPGS